MPFCNRCGTELLAGDAFCGNCGLAQGVGQGVGPGVGPGGVSAAPDPLAGFDGNLAATLCYVPYVGWVGSIIVLSAAKFQRDRETRFHAFQGLYLFVAWLIYDWVLEPILWNALDGAYLLSRAVKLGMIGVWIYMMFQTRQRNRVKLPWVGDLAEQSVAEQR